MINLSPWLNAPAWYIAFSGGLDSTVLLHLLANHACNHQAPPLRALHIHHGLQSAADAWPAHCQSICNQLGIELQVIHVQVTPAPAWNRPPAMPAMLLSVAFSARATSCSLASIATTRPKPCSCACCAVPGCAD